MSIPAPLQETNTKSQTLNNPAQIEFSPQRKCACSKSASGNGGESDKYQRERAFSLQPKLPAKGSYDSLEGEAGSTDPLRRDHLPLASPTNSLGYDFGNVRVHYSAAASLQPKLSVNEPGDKYEQEADRVADEIMRMPEPSTPEAASSFKRGRALTPDRDVSISLQRLALTPAGERNKLTQQTAPLAHHQDAEIDSAQELPRISTFQSLHSPPSAQRQEEQVSTDSANQSEVTEDDAERLPDEPLLLKRETGSPPEVSASFGNGFRQSTGNPMPASTLAYMEPRFGLDFSNIRIHTGSVAHRMSTAIGAAAFTYRNNVFFRNGRFSPETSAGRRLLAHELTHTVQQAGNSTTRARGFKEGPIAIQRAAEVHVNLQGSDRVKVYRDSGGNLGGAGGFVTSSGSPGHETTEGDLSITSKRTDPTARAGKWGLRYFATFSGAQGFHSHITWPKRRTMCSVFGRFCTPTSRLNERVEHLLPVNGRELSHGCARLREPNAQTVFDAVSVGTPVKIYRERNFRPSPFASRGGGTSGTSGRTHTVVQGDTLSEIAEHYSVSTEALRRANGIPTDSDHIEIGQTLDIPSTQ